jgi:predicted amidophosphoribosyltransferase
MTTTTTLTCNQCGAAAPDDAAHCPHCGAAVTHEMLDGGHAVSATPDGVTVSDGGRIAVGKARGETRRCPGCGADVALDAGSVCPFCKTKIVIDALQMPSLVVEAGGSVVIEAGARVVIGKGVVIESEPAPRRQRRKKRTPK